MATATTPLSAKEVAREVGTDARTFRKFLREITPPEDHPGQGGRWTFTKGEANKLRKKFERWAAEGVRAVEETAEAKPAKAKKGKKAKIEEPEELDEELEDLDDPDEEDLVEEEDLELDDEDEDE